MHISFFIFLVFEKFSHFCISEMIWREKITFLLGSDTFSKWWFLLKIISQKPKVIRRYILASWLTGDNRGTKIQWLREDWKFLPLSWNSLEGGRWAGRAAHRSVQLSRDYTAPLSVSPRVPRVFFCILRCPELPTAVPVCWPPRRGARPGSCPRHLSHPTVMLSVTKTPLTARETGKSRL